MKVKILKTLVLVALVALPLKLSSVARTSLERAQITRQMESYADYQALKNIQYIEYVDYFTLTLGAFALWGVWKPKKTKTEHESN